MLLSSAVRAHYSFFFVTYFDTVVAAAGILYHTGSVCEMIFVVQLSPYGF